MGSCSLLQRIIPTQGLNPGLPHCRWILYQLSHERSPEYWSGSLFRLQRIFLAQELNRRLLHLGPCHLGRARLCCRSVTKSCPLSATPWTTIPQASLSFNISQRLLKFMSIASEMLSNHLILCPHPLLSPSPFAFSLSQHQGHFQ